MANKNTTKDLWWHIKDIHIVMLITVDEDGILRSRPMATEQPKFDGYLWFFTKVDSAKVRQLDADPRINLSYTDAFKNEYVSVSGKAELVQDRDRIKDLWNPIYHGWFPDGLEEKDLGLLRVSVEKAERWDETSGRMTELDVPQPCEHEALARTGFSSQQINVNGSAL